MVAHIKLCRQHHARGRLHRRYGDRHVRLRVRPQLQARILQREPLGLVRDRLDLGEEPDDHLQRLVHARPLHDGIDAQHHCIGRERTWPDAEHHPSARDVVEQHHAIRHHQRVVIGQGNDAGA